MPSHFHILATDYTGAIEGLICLAVDGIYLLMLLITAIACMGRRTRQTDDLTRALVWGGIPLAFGLALVAWSDLSKRPPHWDDLAWFAKITFPLWTAGLCLRWWHQRT